MAEEAGSELPLRQPGEGLRVLIASANGIERAGLRGLLGAGGLDVVGEARSGEEVVAQVAALRPDVVIMDLSLPGTGVTEVLGRARDAHPGVPVVIFASLAEPTLVADAIDAGASGYLLKEQDGPELVAAVQAAAAGDMPIAPRAMPVLVEGRRGPTRLTARELEVLQYVAQGFANKQIALRLGITEGTVKSHLGSAFRKLGVTGRTQAALRIRAQLDERGS